MFYGIKYTADWGNYEYLVNNPDQSPDYMFGFFVSLLSEYDVNFELIFKLHVLFMGIAYLLWTRKITSMPELIILFAINEYLLIANQVRFYLAWPIILIAIYELYKRHLLLFLIFSTVSFLCHKTVILVLIAVLLSDFVIQRSRFDKVFLPLVAISIALVPLAVVDFGYEKVSMYQQLHEGATVFGGIWNELPFIVSILIIIRINHIVVRTNKSITETLDYRYLFSLALSSILFFGVGFFVQTIVHRFVGSMVLVWMAYILYCFKFISLRKYKLEFLIYFITIIVITPIFTLVYSIVKNNYYTNELIKTIYSYNFF